MPWQNADGVLNCFDVFRELAGVELHVATGLFVKARCSSCTRCQPFHIPNWHWRRLQQIKYILAQLSLEPALSTLLFPSLHEQAANSLGSLGKPALPCPPASSRLDHWLRLAYRVRCVCHHRGSRIVIQLRSERVPWVPIFQTKHGPGWLEWPKVA